MKSLLDYLKSDSLGPKVGTLIYKLVDLQQVTSPLCALVFLSVNSRW